MREDGHDIYLKYSKHSGVVRNTALRLLAQYFPEEATHPILSVARAEKEGDFELIHALLQLRSKEGFLKVQGFKRHSLPFHVDYS